MRIEHNSTSLVLEQTATGMRAAAIGFFVLFTLMFTVLVASVFMAPRTMTVACDRADGTCVVTPHRGDVETYRIEELDKAVARRRSGSRNSSSSYFMELDMKDGRQIKLGDSDFAVDDIAALKRAAEELERFLKDPGSTTVSVEFTGGDTDYWALVPLGLAVLATAFILARLGSRTRVEVDAVGRSVEVIVRGLIGASRVVVAFDDIECVFALATNSGWATLSLERKDGGPVRLFRLPRTSRVRKIANEILPLLSTHIGVELRLNDRYRRTWAA